MSSSHSKAFIYLKFLIIVCEEVNLLGSCKMPANLRVYQKISFTHPLSCILASFSHNASVTSPKGALKAVLLVIYLFNQDSSKSTFSMLNMSFNVVLSTVFVKEIGILCFLQ